jgi:sigma-E factor negative regulatory protein RseB
VSASRLARRWAPWVAAASLVLPLWVHAAGEADARAWLERMRQAASQGNYEGTMVWSAGGTISSTRVWHYRVGDQAYERVETQDGRLQRIYRHNDQVRTLWPQTRVALVERREALAAWPIAPLRVDPGALEHYELRREGTGRVAGREAAVFLLEPRDALRYAQRVWADLATGLMLRNDVLGPGGQPLESSAFSVIDIGVRPQPEKVTKAMRGVDMPADSKSAASDGWRVLRPAQRRTALGAEGWALRQAVPGFALAGCVVRTIEPDRGQVPVLQAVFTDGLTHVSLFIEPYLPERSRAVAAARIGATTTFARRQGDHWITAVGDVPAETLNRFVDALERRR